MTAKRRVLLAVLAWPGSMGAQGHVTLDAGAGMAARQAADPLLAGAAGAPGWWGHLGMDGAWVPVAGRAVQRRSSYGLEWQSPRAWGLSAMAVVRGESREDLDGVALSRRTSLAGLQLDHGPLTLRIGRMAEARDARSASIPLGGVAWALRAGRGRIRVSVDARRSDLRQPVIIRRDTTWFVAGFPYHQTLERTELRSHGLGVAELRMEAELPIATVSLRAGRHRSHGVTQSRWAGLGVEVPVWERTALVLEGGRRGAVPELALGPTPYATVSMRWRPVREAPRRAAGSSSRTARRTFVAAAHGQELVIEGANAVTLDVMGTMTDWQPVRLIRAGPGRWRFPRVIGPGLHQLLVRIDGAEWQVPPGLHSTRGALGERVGILLVGAGS